MRHEQYHFMEGIPPQKPVVYAIQAEVGGPVKIGFCTNSVTVYQRIDTLQTANARRLVIRGMWPAEHGARTEAEWHERFKEFRLSGEWFANSPEVVEATGASPDGYDEALAVEEAFERGKWAGRAEAFAQMEHGLAVLKASESAGFPTEVTLRSVA